MPPCRYGCHHEAVKPVRLFEWRLNLLVMLVADRTREAVLVVEEKAWRESCWQPDSPWCKKFTCPQLFAGAGYGKAPGGVVQNDGFALWQLEFEDVFFLKQHFMNTCERRFQVVCMISDESAIEVYGIPSYCSLFASYCSLFSGFQSLLLRQVVFSHRILAEPVPFRQKGPWCWPLWTAELRHTVTCP